MGDRVGDVLDGDVDGDFVNNGLIVVDPVGETVGASVGTDVGASVGASEGNGAFVVPGVHIILIDTCLLYGLAGLAILTTRLK